MNPNYLGRRNRKQGEWIPLPQIVRGGQREVGYVFQMPDVCGLHPRNIEALPVKGSVFIRVGHGPFKPLQLVPVECSRILKIRHKRFLHLPAPLYPIPKTDSQPASKKAMTVSAKRSGI